MAKASEQKLGDLHGMVADSIMDELDRALERARAKPDDPSMAVSPQLLAQAMKLLAITGVTAPLAVKKAEDVKSRIQSLTNSDIDLDEEALSPRH